MIHFHANGMLVYTLCHLRGYLTDLIKQSQQFPPYNAVYEADPVQR